MSFDLLYMSSHWSSEQIQRHNPWTGETQNMRPSLPMTVDALSAVKTVLDEAKTTSTGDDGCYLVVFQDGGAAEIFVSNLRNGFMVAVRNDFTPSLLDFLYQLLKAGKMLMCPTAEDPMTIGASDSSFREAPDDVPRQIVCNSSEELQILLSKGIEEWRRFRDQVIGEV